MDDGIDWSIVGTGTALELEFRISLSFIYKSHVLLKGNWDLDCVFSALPTTSGSPIAGHTNSLVGCYIPW
jgi:hypothetical protein